METTPKQTQGLRAEPVTFSVVDYQEIDGLRACENCGHEIKRLYRIRSTGGELMTVGSECVTLLCGRISIINKTEARAKRAASQWRANKPERMKGESKADYVNRRLREMANAMNAHKALIQFERRDFPQLYFSLAKRAARIFNLPHTVNERYGYVTCKCQGDLLCHVHLLRHQFHAHYANKLGRKYGANPYDFNRPAWEVAKV